jgi:protein-L-isoaspartate(D-aspartate) O-methyltransferase
MRDLTAHRERMVERHLARRGIVGRRLLAAMREVPRDEFLAEPLREFAYDDTPLPIAAGQTISQPYIVAAMIEALDLGPEDRVLEVGVGSGYAAAVMSRLCREVYGIERHPELAESAAATCRRLGYDNVRVRHGDGTLGWPEEAPFDAVSVAAAGPTLPQPLLDQLAVGGRLVMPVGSPQEQVLVRVIRRVGDDWEREELGGVRFVPLIGAAGWRESGEDGLPRRLSTQEEEEEVVEEEERHESRRQAEPAALGSMPVRVVPAEARREPAGELARLVRAASIPFAGVEEADVGPLVERIGDARVVLLGEASHGTSEFYRFRARLTRELVERRGFDVVAAEADWPDAAHVDRWVRHGEERAAEDGRPAFSRFPTWMWRNREFEELVVWLRSHNAGLQPDRRVAFHGLDLYSLHSSIEQVVRYLDEIDPEAARVARERYGCLTPWEQDPALYGRAALSGGYETCEEEVVSALTDLLRRRVDYAAADGDRFLDAERNARVVANAERYYRVMYYGSRQSWNLRDEHMFDTLKSVLEFRGPESRAVVWAHNSHNGDAAATEMGRRGETNLGHLSREAFGDAAFLVGFGTDRGTVAAASDWGGEMEIKRVRPSHERSYERVCHDTGEPGFLLPLREPLHDELTGALSPARLERAIGVIYRPQTELASHYFHAVLPRQFDVWIWIDETEAVQPLAAAPEPGLPETWPFGL